MSHNKVLRKKEDTEKSLLIVNELIRKEIGLIEELPYDDFLREGYINNLAVNLRMLMHKTKVSHPLLEQISLIEELNFAINFNSLFGAANIIRESKLLSYKIENNKGYFVSEIVKNPYMYISFSNWWNEVVIDNKDKDDNFVTRKEIILAVANQDGAHTSLKIDRKTHKICHDRGMDLNIKHNGEIVEFKNNPYKEIVVSVAKEYIIALDLYNKVKSNFYRVGFLATNELVISSKSLKNTNNSKRYQIWYRDNKTLPGKFLFLTDLVDFEFNLSSVYCRTYRNKHSNQIYKEYLINENDHNVQKIEVLKDFETQILSVFFNKNNKYHLVRGSLVGNTSTIDRKSIVIDNGYYHLTENVIFDSLELLKSTLGLSSR